MKADAEFSRYSECEWNGIDTEVRRLSSFRHVARIPVDMVRLRDRLELLGRNYASMPRIDLGQRLESLVAKEEQMAEWRRKVLEDDDLPPEVRQRVVDALSEAVETHQIRSLKLGQDYSLRESSIESGPNYIRVRYKVPSPKNTQKAAFNCYLESLLVEWMCIGGEWLPGRETLNPPEHSSPPAHAR
jgi:hypothetical protein